MNILTLGDEKFTKELYEINGNIESIISIISVRLTKKIKKNLINLSIKNKKKISLYPHKKMKDFTFYKNIDWNTIPPLNRKLIEDMSMCEVETLKMYERITSLKPKSYENRKKHYMYSLRYLNYLLDKYKIDVFIRYSMPHMGYDNILYNLCKLKKIKTYIIYFLHPYFGYFAMDVKNQLPNYKIGTEEENFKYDRLKKMVYEYFNNIKLTYKPIVIPNVLRIKRKQSILLRKNKELLAYYNHICINPEYNKKYIYVPLHYQYEATTCPMGGPFVDQILMIEILSKLGIKIYVKEHLRISKNRNINYYNKIKSIKNVYLIPIKTDNYKLIDNSFCVSTVTGTAGWEAILKGKCVLLFGNIFYQYCEYVFNIGSVEDALNAIEKIKLIKYDRRNVIAFLKGIEKFLFPLDYKSIAKNFEKELNKNDC
jgi:hypothetical protein